MIFLGFFYWYIIFCTLDFNNNIGVFIVLSFVCFIDIYDGFIQITSLNWDLVNPRVQRSFDVLFLYISSSQDTSSRLNGDMQRRPFCHSFPSPKSGSTARWVFSSTWWCMRLRQSLSFSIILRINVGKKLLSQKNRGNVDNWEILTFLRELNPS